MKRSYVIVLTHRELGDKPHLAIGPYTNKRRAVAESRRYACFADVVEVVDPYDRECERKK